MLQGYGRFRRAITIDEPTAPREQALVRLNVRAPDGFAAQHHSPDRRKRLLLHAIEEMSVNRWGHVEDCYGLLCPPRGGRLWARAPEIHRIERCSVQQRPKDVHYRRIEGVRGDLQHAISGREF